MTQCHYLTLHGVNHTCTYSFWHQCVHLFLIVLLVIDAMVVSMDCLVRATAYVSFVVCDAMGHKLCHV